MNRRFRYKNKGFNLVELLIVMALLAIVAAFTVPKLLGNTASQDKQYMAKARQVARTILAAHQSLKLSGALTSSTNKDAFTPYLNYVSVKTSGLVDHRNGSWSADCSVASRRCLVLHNGSVLTYSNGSFVGSSSTDSVSFILDPDGGYSNTTNGPGKSVQFYVYYDGRIRASGSVVAGTESSGVPVAADPSQDPSWFTGF